MVAPTCSKQMLDPHSRQLSFCVLWLPLASLSLPPTRLWLSSVLANRLDFCFLNPPKLSYLGTFADIWICALYLSPIVLWLSGLFKTLIEFHFTVSPILCLKRNYFVVNWIEPSYTIVKANLNLNKPRVLKWSLQEIDADKIRLSGRSLTSWLVPL